MAIEFKKAHRSKAKLRLAIAGPSGAGKTYSALLIASGIVPLERWLLLTQNQDLQICMPIWADILR